MIAQPDTIGTLPEPMEDAIYREGFNCGLIEGMKRNEAFAASLASAGEDLGEALAIVNMMAAQLGPADPEFSNLMRAMFLILRTHDTLKRGAR